MSGLEWAMWAPFFVGFGLLAALLAFYWLTDY